MKNIIVILLLWCGAGSIAVAKADNAPNADPNIQNTAPTTPKPATNGIDNGSGDDAATIYDADPEADVPADDVGATPAQRS